VKCGVFQGRITLAMLVDAGFAGGPVMSGCRGMISLGNASAYKFEVCEYIMVFESTIRTRERETPLDLLVTPLRGEERAAGIRGPGPRKEADKVAP